MNMREIGQSAGNSSHRALTWRFGLIIGNTLMGEFSECTGLAVERAYETVAEGGRNDSVHALPGSISYSSITLQRGIISLELWNWLFENVSSGTVKPSLKDVTIEVTNESGDKVYEWTLLRTYPVKWSGPDLNVESDNLAMESIELASGSAQVDTSDSEDASEVDDADDDEEDGVELDEMSLRLVAEKVYEKLRRDLMMEQERIGRTTQWSGWMR